MKDRIKRLMESQHMSQKVFAQFTGISEGSLSGVFNGRTQPSMKMVESIHACLPKVSTDWLMWGTGPMYIDEDTPAQEQNDQSGETQVASGSTSRAPGELLLFDTREQQNSPVVHDTPINSAQKVVKYIDKPQRQITEIRIFFDDQTWETFVPKR